MTDTATDTGAVEGVEAVVQEQPREERHDRPAGYDPVALDDLPPEKQKEIDNRINYLYKQVKDNERNSREFKTIMAQQSALIDELTNGVGQVVNHLHGRQVAETEASIMQEMQTAWESGDNKTYMEKQSKLLDLKMQQRQQPQQRQGNQTQAQAYAGVKQVAAQAEAEGSISSDDTRLVSAWQEETDDRGQPLRPWAKTDDPNDPDPDFIKALTVAKRVWEKNPHKTARENLAEVDRIMGTKQNSGGQNVMGGGLNTPGKKSTIRLTPSQERIAVKTKFGANKGAKSDSEYITAYRKQIESVQSRTKGSR